MPQQSIESLCILCTTRFHQLVQLAYNMQNPLMHGLKAQNPLWNVVLPGTRRPLSMVGRV